jgi:hypothetical protein
MAQRSTRQATSLSLTQFLLLPKVPSTHQPPQSSRPLRSQPLNRLDPKTIRFRWNRISLHLRLFQREEDVIQLEDHLFTVRTLNQMLLKPSDSIRFQDPIVVVVHLLSKPWIRAARTSLDTAGRLNSFNHCFSFADLSSHLDYLIFHRFVFPKEKEPLRQGFSPTQRRREKIK